MATYGLGVIGDSGVDEYRADDNRGGAYASVTFNSIEILNRARSSVFSSGAWGTRSSPRRTGYAYNWALSGATAGSLSVSGAGDIISLGQHTGLAAQITSGLVQLVVIWIGNNDWSPFMGNYDPVYDGTIAGATLTAKINSIVSNLTTAVDTVLAAGSVKVLLNNHYDPGPYFTSTYPNATYRQRVTDAIALVHTSVDSIISARSDSVALLDRANWLTTLTTAYPPSSNNLLVGGETISLYGSGDEPHNMTLADGAHTGTVGKGLEANLLILDRFNAAFGLGITRLTDTEILAQAGLASAPPSGTPVLSVR